MRNTICFESSFFFSSFIRFAKKFGIIRHVKRFIKEAAMIFFEKRNLDEEI